MSNFIKSHNHKSVSVSLEVLLTKEGDYIVAYCPALDLSSYGDDEEDAKLSFEEALDIFMEQTYKRGTLEKVLFSLGWTLRKLPVIKYDPPKRTRSSKYSIHNKPKRVREEILIPVD
jgi:predicted RNase H-like HicB family nuclease